MLKIILVLVLYFVSLTSFAQMASTPNTEKKSKTKHQIKVVINNIAPNNGSVYFALYDSESNFDKRNPLNSQSIPVTNGIANISFEEVEAGVYAITCFYDANNNGRMDFQSNGMPIEDYGATNNVMNFGPPQFQDAKFELTDKDLTFEIKF